MKKYDEILQLKNSNAQKGVMLLSLFKEFWQKERVPPPILFHSDQGVQYSSADYTNLLKSYNVTQSMSRAGVPRDNAVIESFFSRFKDVLSSHFQYWKCDDIHAAVQQTIFYFNNIKYLRRLNKKAPVQYRIELVA